MKRVSAALIVTFVSSALFASPFIEKAKSQTVLVANVGFAGMGVGTGIVLDKHHIVTCAHMAKGYDDRLLVYTYPLGRIYEAKVDFVDVPHDVLFLSIAEALPVKSFAVLQPKIDDGDSVTIIGNTLGAMGWYVSRGVISGTEKYYLLTDASINHGNSGGPWFNDKGQIVAMSDWGIGPSDGVVGIRGGISAKQILASMDEHKKMEKIFSMLGLK